MITISPLYVLFGPVPRCLVIAMTSSCTPRCLHNVWVYFRYE